jgi:L-sorbose 1-phosphate reductase
MVAKKIKQYLEASEALPESQYAWPLYGTGLDYLGKNGAPVKRGIPEYGNDELLMRFDAVSMCFTDVKEIIQGENHPRLTYRDLPNDPIVPGHEFSMTVIGVGANLADQFEIGQRFTMQPDVWVDGKSVPFCFGMDGAYRQYAVIDHRVLNGDAGNYLIPLPADMTYAAAAITEPWACVEASYRMQYRTALRSGGRALFWGQPNSRQGYQIEAGWVSGSKPAVICVCGIPEDLKGVLLALCEDADIDLQEITRKGIEEQNLQFDDVLVLDGSAEDVAFLEEHKAKGAVIALLTEKDLSQSIEIDLGRLHYDEMLYVGTSSKEISKAYTTTPARVEFKEGGIAWILGAGGPMGRMHLQRAIEAPNGPKTIITSNVTEERLIALREFFGPLARKNNKELLITNPVKREADFQAVMEDIMRRGGVDDIEVMAAKSDVVADSCQYLAQNGVVNLFAGMKRGVKMPVDPWLIVGEKQNRFIGRSGSALDDQQAVVDRCASGDMDTNLSVAAVGGLNQIADGIQAMQDSTFAGKIVIFPHVLDFPLTALSDLKSVLPAVAEKLGENDTWNAEVEQAFLENQLS